MVVLFQYFSRPSVQCILLYSIFKIYKNKFWKVTRWCIIVEFWDRKRKWSKNKGNLNTVWTLINNNESILFISCDNYTLIVWCVCLKLASQPQSQQCDISSPLKWSIFKSTHLIYFLEAQLGVPDSSVAKESAFNAGDPCSVPGLEDPLEKGKAGEFYGLYIVHGVAESDMTERLSLHSLHSLHFKAQLVKNLPAMPTLPWRRRWQPTHSSTLVWRIPRTEKPSWLQYMGSQRVRHYCATNLNVMC